MAAQHRSGLDDDAAAVDGVELFHLTAAGQGEAAAWWTNPVRRGAPDRDELAIKVALAVTVPGVDVTSILQTQRTESLRALREFTRLTAAPGTDLAWSLVLDSLVFAVEAEVRWLDHVEARIRRDHLGTRLAAATASPTSTAARPAAPVTAGRTSTGSGTGTGTQDAS